jgi:hypothetical protein
MSYADRDEVAAACGMGPYRALKDSLAKSVAAWTGLVDDKPVVMWGVTPIDILAGIGSPWLLGTDTIRECPITFLRFNRKYVPQMLGMFPVLVNYVDARHERAIRWLKWLGFRIEDNPVPYGMWGMDFFRFEMRKQ